MAEVIPHTGLTLLAAHQAAKLAGMYLVTDGRAVRISPIILPGWREVPMVAKITAPRIDLTERVAV